MIRAALILLATSAQADCTPGQHTYEVRAIKPAYDGDTVALEARLGFGAVLDLGNVRLHGIDAVERNEPAGILARDYLQSLIPDDWFWANSIKDEKGKFGRYLFRLCPDGLDVNAAMVAAGYAVWKDY